MFSGEGGEGSKTRQRKQAKAEPECGLTWSLASACSHGELGAQMAPQLGLLKAREPAFCTLLLHVSQLLARAAESYQPAPTAPLGAPRDLGSQ